MKNILRFVVSFQIVALVFSSSFSIFNSAGKDCKEDESGNLVCSEVCEFDGLKIEPGTADQDNRKCIAVFCSEDFTVTVHTCPYEENPDCTYQHDFKKSFPDCCNKICQRIVQLDNDEEFNKIGVSTA